MSDDIYRTANYLRMHTAGTRVAYSVMAEDICQPMLDRIDELEAASVRCCRGCPDCIGVGAHHQIRALNDRIAELEAREDELLRALDELGAELEREVQKR